jgi:hypothetical protein
MTAAVLATEAACVDFKLKANPTPPEWVITEFLQPLGFDKRVMIIEK